MHGWVYYVVAAAAAWILLVECTTSVEGVENSRWMTDFLSSSSIYMNVMPKNIFLNKKSIVDIRMQRVREITDLSTTYLEMEDMLQVEEMYGTPTSIAARKTKMYNVASLINSLYQEIHIIDEYCKKRVGPRCEQPTCFGKFVGRSENPCSGNGDCVDVDKCQCKNGYYGLECELQSCFGIPFNESNVCSSHGSCIHMDVCLCDDGYYGENCERSKELTNTIVLDTSMNVFKLATGNYIPTTCKEYHSKYYRGSGNGYYLINPVQGTQPFVGYCDMINGGWMLINNNSSRTTTAVGMLTYEKLSSVVIKSMEIKNSIGERCVISGDAAQLVFKDPMMKILCNSVNHFLPILSSLDLLFITPQQYWIK
ncbi:hypothetical protein C9374_003932 [Naegleria lovaniensis]|uniref:EGF-like domain-containing protein n=1 Tax=Naegleria lovaniensis TaxID=51637 RepID=A0AA88H451_NAELO|nr:uncharacterized protein C9374_003932 [Naegleria lovaniensis]KAG2394168.1 hypothetical protein C9374_003932 [Naegleria lovaniensis]